MANMQMQTISIVLRTGSIEKRTSIDYKPYCQRYFYSGYVIS